MALLRLWGRPFYSKTKIVMKKYLTCLTIVKSSKNTLEKDIKDFLIQNNRVVVNTADLEIFKENIIAHINFICQENKRCNPIKFKWFRKFSLNNDFGLEGNIECLQFSLLEIRNEFVINKNTEK